MHLSQYACWQYLQGSTSQDQLRPHLQHFQVSAEKTVRKAKRIFKPIFSPLFA